MWLNEKNAQGATGKDVLGRVFGACAGKLWSDRDTQKHCAVTVARVSLTAAFAGCALAFMFAIHNHHEPCDETKIISKSTESPMSQIFVHMISQGIKDASLSKSALYFAGSVLGIFVLGVGAGLTRFSYQNWKDANKPKDTSTGPV